MCSRPKFKWGLLNEGHDRHSAIPAVWHFSASHCAVGIHHIRCQRADPPARTTKHRKKPTSATLLPYVLTTCGHIRRTVARHNIKGVSLPPRKISSFICPVRWPGTQENEQVKHCLWVWPRLHWIYGVFQWDQGEGAPPEHLASAAQQTRTGWTQGQQAS
jgi:hypothetical protein